MSIINANASVTNGLVFSYDQWNNGKGYLGQPTTNLVPDAANMSGWTSYNNGNDGTFITEFGTTGYKMVNRPSWNGVYRSIPLPSTGTYTFSCWIRYHGGTANNNGGTVYVSAWGGSDSNAGSINKSLIGQWQRLSLTLNCTSLNPTLYLISYGGTQDGNSDRSSWDITMPQVEAGSTATPFVSGTRSTTQAIRDLTGNTTITANSLTYNTGAAAYTAPRFSFASGNYFSVANTSAIRPTNEMTIEYVIKGTSPSAWNQLFGYGSGAYSSGNYLIWVENNGGLHALCRVNNTEYRCTPSVTISNSVYTHMIYTMKTGDAIRPYINGVASGTVTSLPTGSFTYNATTSAYQVGVGGAANFVGDFPYIKIYNRALTPAECRQNFQANRGRYGL